MCSKIGRSTKTKSRRLGNGKKGNDRRKTDKEELGRRAGYTSNWVETSDHSRVGLRSTGDRWNEGCNLGRGSKKVVQRPAEVRTIASQGVRTALETGELLSGHCGTPRTLELSLGYPPSLQPSQGYCANSMSSSKGSTVPGPEEMLHYGREWVVNACRGRMGFHPLLLFLVRGWVCPGGQGVTMAEATHIYTKP